MSYKSLIQKHPEYLAYGGLHYFFSSIGQTFLISVSVPFILSDLHLSSAYFSNGYAVATICSALILPLMGSWVDKFPLKILSLAGSLGLILACIIMYSVNSIWLLVLGLFLLRFFGQGSMILIGATAIAKFFDKNRGKALSLSSMGLALAETVMPLILISWINPLGWRSAWILLAVLAVIMFIPATQFLIKRHDESNTDEAIQETTKPANFSRTQVLKDPKFYLILPAYIFLPFFITGIFIHQNKIAAAQNWSLEWMAFSFVVYGIAKVVTAFFGGTLIDRFSAMRVFVFYLIPLALGLILLLLSNEAVIALIYMAMLGATASLGSLTGVAMWAELYGTKNLGAIKSMTTTFMVIATALGPIVIGWGFDRSIETTLICAVLAIVIIVFSNFYTLKNPNRK